MDMEILYLIEAAKVDILLEKGNGMTAAGTVDKKAAPSAFGLINNSTAGKEHFIISLFAKLEKSCKGIACAEIVAYLDRDLAHILADLKTVFALGEAIALFYGDSAAVAEGEVDAVDLIEIAREGLSFLRELAGADTSFKSVVGTVCPITLGSGNNIRKFCHIRIPH